MGWHRFWLLFYWIWDILSNVAFTGSALPEMQKQTSVYFLPDIYVRAAMSFLVLFVFVLTMNRWTLAITLDWVLDTTFTCRLLVQMTWRNNLNLGKCMNKILLPVWKSCFSYVNCPWCREVFWCFLNKVSKKLHTAFSFNKICNQILKLQTLTWLVIQIGMAAHNTLSILKRIKLYVIQETFAVLLNDRTNL